MAQSAQVQKNQDITVREQTVSERFTLMVVKELSSTVGHGIELSEDQKRLAQHLFVKIDATLNALEVKRAQQDRNGTPITWANVNMQKLALDAMHRIELGLDALIPNHIHPIPYLNKKTGKYDLDLRIGYSGKDYYRRGIALEKPKDIIYELVYSTDKFVAHKRSLGNEGDSYEFEITQPFDRGDVVGGFGYIVYDDPSKNKLILVTKKDFDKSRKAAKSDEFWGKHPVEMMYKTLVHRVTDKLTMDPRKVTASFAAVEQQEYEAEVEAEIQREANQDIIDVQAETAEAQVPDTENPPMTEQEKAEALEREKKEAEQGELFNKGSRRPNF
ncbi:MAG TPA: recombinase RecT [Deltaproteobacteria bacterium]|nr:recombinase RecT [Deltaproteobacteria bacterium]